jgi:hypothetical protein
VMARANAMILLEKNMILLICSFIRITSFKNLESVFAVVRQIHIASSNTNDRSCELCSDDATPFLWSPYLVPWLSRFLPRHWHENPNAPLLRKNGGQVTFLCRKMS